MGGLRKTQTRRGRSSKPHSPGRRRSENVSRNYCHFSLSFFLPLLSFGFPPSFPLQQCGQGLLSLVPDPPTSFHLGNYPNVPPLMPPQSLALHSIALSLGEAVVFSCISLHKNPTPSCGSIPGNPRGRAGGSAPLHVTAATSPCRARKPRGAAPPLPGTLEEGRRGTPRSRAPKDQDA